MSANAAANAAPNRPRPMTDEQRVCLTRLTKGVNRVARRLYRENKTELFRRSKVVIDRFLNTDSIEGLGKATLDNFRAVADFAKAEQAGESLEKIEKGLEKFRKQVSKAHNAAKVTANNPSVSNQFIRPFEEFSANLDNAIISDAESVHLSCSVELRDEQTDSTDTEESQVSEESDSTDSGGSQVAEASDAASEAKEDDSNLGVADTNNAESVHLSPSVEFREQTDSSDSGDSQVSEASEAKEDS